MSELTSFLAARRQELQAKNDELVRQLMPIQEELRELAETERFLSSGARAPADRRRGARQRSIQDMALAVLAAQPAGVTAEIIREEIFGAFGRQLTRESLAPQLSRFRQAGKIENRSGVYRLTGSGALAPSTERGS